MIHLLILLSTCEYCSGDIPDTPLALRQVPFPAARCHDCDIPPPLLVASPPSQSLSLVRAVKLCTSSPLLLRLCHVGAVLGSVVLKRYEVQVDFPPVIILHLCLIHVGDDSVLLEQTFVGVIPQQYSDSVD